MSFDPWQSLGIAPTGNEPTIRAAYQRLVQQVQDPAALKRAYAEALRRARVGELEPMLVKDEEQRQLIGPKSITAYALATALFLCLMLVWRFGKPWFDEYRFNVAIDAARVAERAELSGNSDVTHQQLLPTADAVGQYHQALALVGEDAASAIELLEPLVKEHPQETEFRNLLAWILATNPNSSPAEIESSLGHARRTNELSGFQNPVFVDTLAAAHARLGEYAAALSHQQHVVALYGKRVPAPVQARLELYQEGRAYVLNP